MWRVLKLGGVIAIVLQPIWARTESEVKQIDAGLVALLSSVVSPAYGSTAYLISW